MERVDWTDERISAKMDGIDRTFEMMRDEFAGLRTELREGLGGLRTELRTELRGEIGGLRTEMRGEMVALRSDFNSLQRQLIQIGFGMVAVMVAALVTAIIAIA